MSRPFFAALLVAAGLAASVPSQAAPEAISPRVYLYYPEVVQIADSHERLRLAAIQTHDAVALLTSLRLSASKIDVCDETWKPQDDASVALVEELALRSLATAKDVLDATQRLPVPMMPQGAEGHSAVQALYEDAVDQARSAAADLVVVSQQLGSWGDPDIKAHADDTLVYLELQVPANSYVSCACTVNGVTLYLQCQTSACRCCSGPEVRK